MEHIRLLAGKAKNNLVNIVELQRMGQGNQETIMQFSTRLNGHADLCDFSIDCTACGEQVSYKEKDILHKFVKGLADQQTQEKILESSAAVEGGELSLTKVLKIAQAHKMGKLCPPCPRGLSPSVSPSDSLTPRLHHHIKVMISHRNQ